MLRRFALSLAPLLAAVLSFSAQANTYYVDISAQANWDTAQVPPLTGGWAFNTFPGTNQVYTGSAGTNIPFYLAASGTNNVWLGTSTASTTFNVNIADATTAYALLNSHWGQAGVNELQIDFIGTGGTSISFMLVGGVDIRGWANGTAGVNTLTLPTATNWWTGPPPTGAGGNTTVISRLDAQTFDLGTTFAGQTLTQIVFTPQARVGASAFVPILSGLTIAAVPEADTYVLLLSGLGIVFFAAGRRNKNMTGPRRLSVQ